MQHGQQATWHLSDRGVSLIPRRPDPTPGCLAAASGGGAPAAAGPTRWALPWPGTHAWPPSTATAPQVRGTSALHACAHLHANLPVRRILVHTNALHPAGRGAERGGGGAAPPRHVHAFDPALTARAALEGQTAQMHLAGNTAPAWLDEGEFLACDAPGWVAARPDRPEGVVSKGELLEINLLDQPRGLVLHQQGLHLLLQ